MKSPKVRQDRGHPGNIQLNSLSGALLMQHFDALSYYRDGALVRATDSQAQTFFFFTPFAVHGAGGNVHAGGEQKLSQLEQNINV